MAALLTEEAPTSRRECLVGGVLMLIGVALAAANMRPAVTSLASLLGEVQGSLGATATWTSLVTSIPTVCFGVVGIAAPLLARRWGPSRIIGFSLAVLTTALLLRVVAGQWGVLLGTVVSCAALACCNVLIPVVVKESFPTRIGMATGLYTTAMAAGGSAGSALTPWLMSSTGSWRLSLATWAAVAFAALCVWVPATLKGPASPVAGEDSAPAPHRSLLRSPLAWVITCYFGLQALIAYVVMGWLPEVFKGAGMDSASAGLWLGVLLLIGVPINMALPPLVTRSRSQSGWALALAVLGGGGVLGLLFAPLSAPWLWSALLGIGMSSFPLALVMISLRTSNAADTGQLSAMAQGFGYLIASVGPFLFGVLHEVTATWSPSLIGVLGVFAVQGLAGILAGRPRTV